MKTQKMPKRCKVTISPIGYREGFHIVAQDTRNPYRFYANNFESWNEALAVVKRLLRSGF